MALHVYILQLFFTNLMSVSSFPFMPAVHLFPLLCSIPLLDHLTIVFSLDNKYLHSFQGFTITN